MCLFLGRHGCKLKGKTATSFLAHLRGEHRDAGRRLLELFAADGAPLKRCACQRLFPLSSIVKHQKKCSVDTSAQPATKAAPDPNNWVANVPWDQLNEDVLRAISQPGVPMYVGLKGGNYSSDWLGCSFSSIRVGRAVPLRLAVK